MGREEGRLIICDSLTGADTVVFYDSDFNPQMDKQCEDRCVSVCLAMLLFV